MNIENLLKVSQYKNIKDLMLLSAVSAPLNNQPLPSLQLCQICSSEVVCATFWARESRPASPASDSVCPPAERLWPTDGHVTTLLSLQWEAGGWWTGDGVTLDGPWSLCPRVLTLRSPRPVTGVNDQLTPQMQAKHFTQIPQIFPPASWLAG